MPLKYLADWPYLTPHAGMIHGFTPRELLRTFLASLIPLGAFLNDRLFQRHATRRQA